MKAENRVIAAGLLGACLIACGGGDNDSGRKPTVSGPTTTAPIAGAAGAGPGLAGQVAPMMPPTSSGMPNAGTGAPPMAGNIAPTMPPPVMPMAGTGMMGMAGTMSTGMAGSVAPPPPSGDLCARWKAARVNLTESPWTGDVAACTAGDMSAEDRMKAYGLHSLYRQMAGLEPVMMTDEGNRLAQECSLLMAANGKISHTPDSSWTCYTKERADTAGSSSLSSGGAISSVDGYMIDPGNPTTIGHRRWILSNMLASVGFGSAGRFSCQYQPPKRPVAGAMAWVAWPPKGQVPVQALGNRFSSVDQTGWSVQSDTIAFTGAMVTVTSGGMDLPVTVTQLDRGYGSTNAMRFNPMGWKSEAGKTYSVKISGLSMPIEYDVQVVDCP